MANCLRSARNKANISQQKLGVAVQKDHSYISRIESGMQTLNVAELLALLAVLKLDPKEFLCAFLDECR